MASNDFARLVETTRARRSHLSERAVVERRFALESEAWSEYAKRERSTAAARPRMSAEVFGGNQMGRLFRDWVAVTMSPDGEIRGDIRGLRNRARQLVRDNSHAAGFVNEFALQVIGPNEIRLQSKIRNQSGDLISAVNAEIEKKWKRWGMPENASADRRSSWADMQRAWFRALPMDGEIILRHLDYHENEFGYTIQQIDPDLLDESYNLGGSRDRNEIRMGVELDRWGGPVAYWFWNRHPQDNTSGIKLERIRVPASEIVHKFIQYRPGQTRGYSWFAPVLLDLKMLDGYQQAELVATRMAAAKMGFLVQKNPELVGGSAATKALDDDQEMETAPGVVEELPPGWEFQGFDPTHPSTAFKEFTKCILRSVSRGLNMAYTTLTGDLEAVNYSSIRAGLMSERDQYRMLAQWAAVHICRPVYMHWIKSAILHNAVRVDARLASEYDEVEWQGRGWKWVDPLNDLQAAELAIRLGLTTRHRLAAEVGTDLEENIDQLAEENDYADKAGVDISGSTAPAQANNTLESGDDPRDNAAGEKPKKDDDTNALALRRRRIA
jgi:lambda family phage portal protein